MCETVRLCSAWRRLASISLLCVLPFQAIGQMSDPVEKTIEQILKQADILSDPSNSVNPPGATSGVQTLQGGITLKVLPNGTKVFTRPDGTRQYVTRDGKTLTIRPDGSRVLQEAGQPPQRRPAPIDDPERFRPQAEPRPLPDPPTSSVGTHAPADSFRMPDPVESRGRHASWDDLANPPFSTQPIDTALPRYTPPADGSKDSLTSSSQIGTSATMNTYGSGTMMLIFPGGADLTVYPGLPQAVLRSPDGSISNLQPGPDGSIQREIAGQTVTLDPATGTAYIRDTNSGNRYVARSDGTWGYSDDKGGTEWRGPQGLIRSEVRDPTTGNTFRLDGTGVITVEDSKNRPIGLGVNDGSSAVISDARGNPLPISQIVDPSNFPDNAASRATRSAAANAPPQAAGYVPPPARTIFDIASEVYKKVDKENKSSGRSTPGGLQDLRSSPSAPPRSNGQGQSDLSRFLELVQKNQQRFEAIKRAGELLRPPPSDSDEANRSKLDPKAPGNEPSSALEKEDELERSLKLVNATLRKSDLEDQLKVKRQQLDSEKSTLKQEQDKIGDEKVQLLLRESRAASMIKEAQSTLFSLNIERNGILQLEIVLTSQENLLEPREKKSKAAVADALKRIDYSKYKRCPEGQPYMECGHGDIKKKWLNEQLAALLGPGGLAELQKVAQERAKLNEQRKQLEDKKKALDEKEAQANASQSKAEEQSASLKAERDRLEGREKELQKQADNSQKEVDRITKELAQLDDEIKKYSAPPPK